MIFSLTTRWNARRHETGETMLEEILSLGFDHVELGFDLTPNLVPGVRSMVAAGLVKVDSLHAYCPLPPVPFPSPEPFTLSASDPSIRANAFHYLENTIRFAAEIGARVVVVHAGNVEMKMFSPQLVELTAAGRQYDEDYEKIRMQLIVAREKAVTAQLPHLYAAVERLLPLLEETQRTLAFEILPTWEAIPTEVEMEKLLTHFNSPRLRCWLDMGHGQIRENIGLISHARWAKRLRPWLAGMHIHDVRPPATDHLMPPAGSTKFELFKEVAQDDILRVLEPSPAVAAEDIVAGLKIIQAAWMQTVSSRQ
jgi:sugar phosphate isomerase/epimerase